jgi:hypothetical protein
MKRVLLALVFLVAACAPPSKGVQTTAGNPNPILPTMAPLTAADDEAPVRALIEGFGRALQKVSLQAPNAAQEMQREYSEFVSPALLETWMNAPLSAPGRIASSPWPDHIDITMLAREAPGTYAATGFVVDMTSLEVAKGGEAGRYPVRILVQSGPIGWRITQFAQDP